MSMEMKAAETYTSKNALLHHGILGQKWGVTNGPPYPLDDSISTGKRLKTKNKTNREKVNKMDYETLKHEVEKLRLEQQYRNLMAEKRITEQSKARKLISKYSNKAMDEVAKQLTSIAADAIATAIVAGVKSAAAKKKAVED